MRRVRQQLENVIPRLERPAVFRLADEAIGHQPVVPGVFQRPDDRRHVAAVEGLEAEPGELVGLERLVSDWAAVFVCARFYLLLWSMAAHAELLDEERALLIGGKRIDDLAREFQPPLEL